MDQHLDFEQPIYTCLEKIEELKKIVPAPANLAEEIAVLEHQSHEETEKIYANLSPWQKVLVARHPNRPHTLDYIANVFEGFEEMHGDRLSEDDKAIVGGFAFLDNYPVVVIGHEKGRDTDEKVKRNFGMTNPEGYRKAKRLMNLAEQFSLPVVTFVDTAGAYPGVEGEERCQSEAIARNLATMSELKTPILVIVSGEGGSGGALAISVGDHLSMLEYSIYSVASPEACASIIWRSSEKAPDAAEAMKVSSSELKKINIVDEIIQEPLGGAHRDYDLMSENIKGSLIRNLSILNKLSIEDLLERRYKRILSIGS